MKIKGMIVSMLLFLTILCSNVFAIPILQLYIEGATYDPVTESWVITSSNFNLWVIGNTSGPGSAGDISNVYLAFSIYGTDGSISVTPTTTSLLHDPSVPSTLTGPYPTSPITIPAGVENHEEYSSADNHLFYGIGNFTLSDSPVGDFINDFPTTLYPNSGQINVYSISITGYEKVHFDAFDTVVSGVKARVVFAPFSHDASAQVPEPTTVSLLGIGLLGMGVLGRKFRTKP